MEKLVTKNSPVVCDGYVKQKLIDQLSCKIFEIMRKNNYRLATILDFLSVNLSLIMLV